MTARRLSVGGHLDRYVAKLFAASLGVAMLLVVGIFLILDLSSNLDDFRLPGEDGVTPSGLLILQYYVLQTPFVYLQVAPLVTLLAGLFSVAKLMRHQEIIAALNAGVRSQRVLAPILAGGVLLAICMIGFREWATESLSNRRDALHDYLRNGRTERVVKNLWLKDSRRNAVKLGELHAGTAFEPEVHIRDLLAIVRTSDKWTRIEADEARYVTVDGQARWKLKGGTREAVEDAEKRRTRIDFLEEIDFTPADALLKWRAEDRPMDLSFREAMLLAERDPDNVQYQTLLQYHFSFPVANVVLLIVGLPFLLRFQRGRGAEGVASGFLVCIFFFATDLVTRSLGMEGQLGPILAGWLPIALFGSLGIVLFGSMKS